MLIYVLILYSSFLTAQALTPEAQQTIKAQLVHDTFHAIVAESSLPDLSFNKETNTYTYQNRQIRLSVDAMDKHVAGETNNTYFQH